MRADLMIPYGCRNGACGTCKGTHPRRRRRLRRAPAVDADRRRKAQRAWRCSASREPQTGSRRSRCAKCAARATSRSSGCRAAIESIDKPAPDVAIVRLKLPANERLQYLAGQYIDFLLKDGHRRSFSLATPPHADELLELHIRHTPGGFFTDPLFTTYKGREILRFEGPLGTFYLREDIRQADDLRRRRHRASRRSRR